MGIYAASPDRHHFPVTADIQKLWRSVAVEGIDESKIGDHLHKQGITSMQDVGIRVVSSGA